MLKKFYLKDNFKNKIYVEHYLLEEDYKKNEVVILLHGFAEHSNLEKYNILTSLLLDDNFEVIKFDFTGHGNSKGIVKYEYFFSNLKKVYEYALKNYENINFVSYSISGYVVLKFIKKIIKNKSNEKSEKNNVNNTKKIKKVIFLNPYFGYSKTKILDFKKILQLLFFRKMTFYNKYDSIKLVVSKSFFDYRKKILEEYKKDLFDFKSEIKFFIIHGKYDNNVPLESSKYAYEKMSKKNFVLLYIVDDDHFFRRNLKLVFKKILHFLKV